MLCLSTLWSEVLLDCLTMIGSELTDLKSLFIHSFNKYAPLYVPDTVLGTANGFCRLFIYLLISLILISFHRDIAILG